MDELEMEKKRGEELDRISKARQTHCWWESPIEELDLPQLELLKVGLEDLKKKVAKQKEQLLIPSSNATQSFAPDSYGGVPYFEPENDGYNKNVVPNANNLGHSLP
uniref:Uncharacterized protein MANES_10G100400 n=1 Tax=Rhizophora mucronata TaxID=61149 RepID=A0A2P2MS28_RHIMU